jgi:hypothetical protein
MELNLGGSKMALEAYINGKSSEYLVKGSLRAIGCYVDERLRFRTELANMRQSGQTIYSKHFSEFPFQFLSQQGIKNVPMQLGVDKISDFKSANSLIEVKSVSEKTKNKKQSNKKLIGEIIYEYKQYTDYFECRSDYRDKENVYYVLIGPCDKELILSYLEDSRSWHWMKERFHVVYLDELVEIFSRKIEDYNSKLVA